MSKPSREESRARREAKLQDLSATFETAVQRLVTGQDWLRAVEFAARFRSRSFANTLLIHLQHAEAYEKGRVPEPTPTLVAGFKQWEELGRAVQKGQRGYMIWAPVTARFASPDTSDPNRWRRLQRGEKPAPGETVATKMIAAKPAYVWDVSQTDGEPLPQRPRPAMLAGQAPVGLWDGIAAQVRDLGYSLLDAGTATELGGADGITDYRARTVTVRRDMNDAARVTTLVHELAHILLGHEQRHIEGVHRGIAEVAAESTAAMVTAAFGMDTGGASVPYVAGWSTTVKDQDPVEVVRATGETVRKAALVILDKLPEPPTIGDGTPPGLDRRTPEPRRPVSPSPSLKPRLEAASSAADHPALGM